MGFKKLFKGLLSLTIMEEHYEGGEVDENTLANEFGEEINKYELVEIADKVRKLEAKDIDELFFDCGWKDKNRGKNKALPIEKIEEMKADEQTAIQMVTRLFEETPKDEFKYLIRERTSLTFRVEVEEDIDD